MWFKTERELDEAITAFEERHGIICWTDGSDSVKSLFSKLQAEADAGQVQEDGTVRAVAPARVYVTRYAGAPAVVLTQGAVELETVTEYLELVASPVGTPKARKRVAAKRPRKSRAKPKAVDLSGTVDLTGPAHMGPADMK